jgi:hypothetical protein
MRNIFPTHSCTLLFSASFYSENTKHIYFLAHTTKTQKHHYRIIFLLLHCYLLYRIAYYIIFYLHLHLMFDNHLVELGTQDKKIVLHVAWKRMSGAFWLFPESSILNPKFPHGENLLLLQHSIVGVPTSWHLCLVSSSPLSSPRTRRSDILRVTLIS